MANDPAAALVPLGTAVVSGFEAITVADYLARWLAHVRTRVRPATYDGYESLVRCHINPALGQLPLAELHPLHLQDLYTDRLTPTPARRPSRQAASATSTSSSRSRSNKQSAGNS